MPTLPRFRAARTQLFTLVWVAALTTQLSGQSNRFTVDDVLEVANISVADLSNDGRWIVATSGTLRDRLGNDNRRFGDPSYLPPGNMDLLVIDTRTGESRKVFNDRRQVRSMRWSPDGTLLALLSRRGDGFEPMIWERATGKLRPVALPAGRVVADNASLQWSSDGQQLFFTVRDAAWRKQAADGFTKITSSPIVVQSSSNPFMAWEELGRLSLQQSVAVHNLKASQTRELLNSTKLRSFTAAPDGALIRYLDDITTKTDYDVIGGNDNQLKVLPVGGGETRTVLASTKGLSIQWSGDEQKYAYAKDGAIFVGSIDDKEPRRLLGPSRERADSTARQDSTARANERFTVTRISNDGSKLIASNRQGLWLVNVADASKELFLPAPPESDETSPRYSVVEWSRDGKSIYLSYAARTQWERGFAKYDVTAKQLRDLVKDARMYSGLRLSEDGSTLVFTIAEGNRPSDLYTSDADLRNVRRLTDVNAKLRDKNLGRTQLFSYFDSDGKKLYGVLYLPIDYVAGQKYPVIFNVYETFFDDGFNATTNVLTANGYAVAQPSVNLEIGYPGEAWAKGVTAAANKLVEMGIADPDKLGVQGTSYGGYATNLLITQTSRFKAAINISGKVDMISFYTDSPRLGVRNIHAPEKSQDRLGATLWQAPQKYIEHSAIFAADRIKTPLLLMTGREDHNVPERTSMEMYYALRRLGKEVEWVSYTYGGHGMPTNTVEEVKDYHARILGWYDRFLKGAKKVADQ
jgi:dipeptidyl aminopeptidase/acylaminoacyl peptidase